jgi:CPA2 family monovalent cation:H+ antiporter-2
VAVLGRTPRLALTVAVGLAQIGEFSFILSDLARRHGILPGEGHDVLVATAIVSITLNPLLFRSLDRFERWLKARPRLWNMLNARAERRMRHLNESVSVVVSDPSTAFAVVVGHGPVGATVDRILRQAGLRTVVIDLNVDTVRNLTSGGRSAIFGDASQAEVLKQAGIAGASHLVVTLPHSSNRGPLVAVARELNPSLRILVRARYLRERAELEQAGATSSIFEEAEAAIALARIVLQETGADPGTMESEIARIRSEFAVTV